MLENYYDVAKADEFGRLFGHLKIGKSPTQLHNKYLVMNWDFSALEPPQATSLLLGSDWQIRTVAVMGGGFANPPRAILKKSRAN